MWHAHDGMGWWMVFGGGMWMLLLILVIVGALMFLRPAIDRTARSDRPHDERAIEIVRQRYARGEISREEFEQLRHDLERNSTPNQTSAVT